MILIEFGVIKYLVILNNCQFPMFIKGSQQEKFTPIWLTNDVNV